MESQLFSQFISVDKLNQFEAQFNTVKEKFEKDGVEMVKTVNEFKDKESKNIVKYVERFMETTFAKYDHVY